MFRALLDEESTYATQQISRVGDLMRMNLHAAVAYHRPHNEPPDIAREGLTILFDNTESMQSGRGVDYVFVHGLNGDPKNSWTHPSGFYWLWHLREDLKAARVMVFGYNGDFERGLDSNRAGLKSIAEAFINALIDEREDELTINTLHRDRNAGAQAPYIQLQNQVYDSIVGLVFMGTPHAGSNIPGKKRVKLLQSMAKATFKSAPEKLVQSLEAHSDSLVDLSDNFEKTTIFTQHQVSVCTYYELRTTKLLGEEVVPEDMATLHYINERRQGIPADHEFLVKYGGPRDPNYKTVMKELRRMGAYHKAIKAASGSIDSSLTINIAAANIVESYAKDGRDRSHREQRGKDADDNAKFAAAMKFVDESAKHARDELANYQRDIQEQGLDQRSFAWFAKMPEYCNWIASKSPALLWSIGQPELTTAAVFKNIALELQKSHYLDPKIEIVHVFCTQPMAMVPDVSVSILRSLISQVLWSDNDRIRLVQISVLEENEQSKLLGHRQELSKSFQALLCDSDVTLEELWSLLRIALRTSPEQQIHIVLTDVDILGPKSQAEILKGFQTLCLSLERKPAVQTRFLVSSRLNLDLQNQLNGVSVFDEGSERRKCLLSLYFGGLHARRNRVSQPKYGTDQWIWKHPAYVKWLQQASSILLIQGKPGSGKSTLARLIQNTLFTHTSPGKGWSGNPSSASVVVDYFYSARGGLSEVDHRLMLQSILYQVLNQRPEFYRNFLSSFRRLLAGSANADIVWDYPELRDIFLSLANDQSTGNTSNPCQRIYLLLDALDESEDEDESGRRRLEVLALLRELCSKQGYVTVKAIVLSRPTTQIEHALKGCHHIRLDQENRADVEKIIDAGLDTMWELMNDKDEESDPESESETTLGSQRGRTLGVSLKSQKRRLSESARKSRKILTYLKEHLLEKASGVILWVVLILGELISHVGKGSHSNTEITEKLEALPTDLEKMFEEIVRRLQKLHNERDITQARLMLTWASFAKRPLSVREFRDAIALPTGSQLRGVVTDDFLHNNRISVPTDNWAPVQRRIVQTCDSLMEVVVPNSQRLVNIQSRARRVLPTYPVQLLHQTVKDFLQYNKNAAPLNIDRAEGETAIASVSIQYLFLALPFEQLREEPIEQWNRSDYTEFVEHLEDYTLLPYIFAYIPQHLAASGNTELCSNLARYLEKNEEAHGHTYAFLEGWSRNNSLINSKSSVRGAFRSSCLEAAAEAGCADVTLLLLSEFMHSSEDTVNLQRKAVHAAATGGNEVLLETLLVSGASIETADEVGRTSLHKATKGGHIRATQVLLANHAKVEARDYEGITPLREAAEGGHDVLVDLLLHHGADLEVRDNFNRTPLHGAVCKGQESTTRLLLSRGAKMNVRDHDYRTPLHYAARMGYTAIMRQLIESGAYITAFLLIAEMTPLHEAAAHGQVEAVQMLLMGGADIHAEGYRKGTALHQAAIAGHEALVELLLAEGADPRAKDYQTGETALQWAERNDHEGVVRLLSDAIGLLAKDEAPPISCEETSVSKEVESTSSEEDEPSPRNCEGMAPVKQEDTKPMSDEDVSPSNDEEATSIKDEETTLTKGNEEPPGKDDGETSMKDDRGPPANDNETTSIQEEEAKPVKKASIPVVNVETWATRDEETLPVSDAADTNTGSDGTVVITLSESV
ncbi:hypothetical protein MMC30_000619 [Trapelia coarctata]|nr:hypothetical protein [Trapelia coarctata]